MKQTVLLVEDRTSDADFIRELLNEPPEVFRLVTARYLTDGLERLQQHDIDVLLLDLDLPDSAGLDTLRRVMEQTSDLPVIVITGTDDEALARKAVHLGAQDYLVKGDFNRTLILRSIAYAIERNLLRLKVLQMSRNTLQEPERPETKSDTPLTSVTFSLMGEARLKDSVPKLFQELVLGYTRLLTLTLDELLFKESSHVTNAFQTLTDELGRFKAGPQDVIDVHLAGLQHVMQTEDHAKAEAYAREGRVTVLRLMGFLATYYRKRSV